MHDIAVKEALLAPNDDIAAENRQLLRGRGVYAVNLMSAPGAGKTTLLERLLPLLAERHKVAVIEGDIAGRADADRVERLGIRVEQINTGSACHLDARMVHRCLHALTGAQDAPDVIVIENVGNLVCPAEFDLGEDHALMLLSVAEGHDKPKKYPLMFRRADAVVLNKIDLLPHTDFDLAAATAAIHDVHPGIDVIPASCLAGDGIERVAQWLEARIAARQAAAFD